MDPQAATPRDLEAQVIKGKALTVTRQVAKVKHSAECS